MPSHTDKKMSLDKDTYWISFHFMGNGTEWIDQELPIPSYLEHINKGYIIAWAIDGYFGTQKATKYLNDIIARVLITFKDLKPKRQLYKPRIESASHYLPKIYKLQELKNLKSIKNRNKAPTRADNFEDYVFWSIKLFCEDIIRAQGLPTFSQLEDFAYLNFEYKDKSTLRAKCRSIYKWYEANNWKLPYQRKTKTAEELKVTRQERAITNTKAREEKARRKVINAVTGLMAETYKKKTGSWNITKIATDTQLNRRTVSKYIKELNL